MSRFIYSKDDKFYCKICDEQLTIFSENGGEGFRARCTTCRKTYYYPTCDICDQPAWKHDIENCFAAMAKSAGKRYCRKCKTVKELSEFNVKGDNISSRCKVCQSKYFKEWYEENKGNRAKSTPDEDVDDFLDEIFGGSSKW